MNTMKQQISSLAPTDGEREPLAIVGIGCRVPGGASDWRSYWDFLCEGRLGISEMPQDRWNLRAFWSPEPGQPGRTVTKWGGFVPDFAAFDAAFFGISPREAESMDPQQRAMLQVAWEALEDAGIPPHSLAGTRTAVFVGASLNDYSQVQRFRHGVVDPHAGTGNALSIIANRISHRLDLRGPSAVVDTACSSSLVATDLAVSAVLDDDCDLALACGVNALFDPGPFVNFSQANMMSPRGRCHTFDASADGYVRAEGAGVLVLKRLSRALADGDRIHALIRGTAVNQDGRTSTITVPSAESQAAMLRLALARSGLAARDIGFAEAHGTGTPVGDPIESYAIGTVFGRPRMDLGGVMVGAGKTNIGHAESGAGILGLIKSVLCLKHHAVPPNLNFSKPNPNIDLEGLGLDLPLKLRSWDQPSGPLAAAVNSFGFGGTNGCAILSEAPVATHARSAASAPAKRAAEPDAALAVVSAASPEALRARAGQLAAQLEQEPGLTAVDLANNLARRRSRLGHIVALDAADRQALLDGLRHLAKAEEERGEAPAGTDPGGTDIVTGHDFGQAKPVFVFSGQGGQWWAMGRQLLAEDAVFRAALEDFDGHFTKVSGWSVIEALSADEADSLVDRTDVTQPAIFAIQCGLVERWRAWGVQPAAVVGHSLGEVAAAWASGAITLKQAAYTIYHRARLSATTEGQGAIAAVGLTPERARQLIASAGCRRLEIAAVNGSEMVTVAGDKEELESFLAGLQKDDPDLFVRRVRMSYAPHTSLMDPIEAELTRELSALTPAATSVPMISTVSGAPIEGHLLGPDYWWRNIRQPVLFKAAIAHAARDGHSVFLEIGPHASLTGMTNAILQEGNGGIAVTSLLRGKPEAACLRHALTTLVANGVEPDWEALHGRASPFVALPRYPWESKRYWLESEEWRRRFFQEPVHPLLGHRQSHSEPLWQGTVDLRSQRYLADHGVGGSVIFPAAGYVEILLAAAAEVLGEEGPIELEELTFFEAMVIERERPELVRTRYDEGRRRFTIHSRSSEGEQDWTLRASAKLGFVRPRQSARAKPLSPAKDIKARSGKEYYQKSAELGFDYGASFQGIRRIWANLPLSQANVQVPKELPGGLEGYRLHPAVFDSCLQVGNGAFIRSLELGTAADAGTFLPVRIGRLRWYRPMTRRLAASSEVTAYDGASITFSHRVATPAGDPVVEVEGQVSQKLGRSGGGSRRPGAQLGYYRESWVEQPLAEPATAGEGTPKTWLLLADDAKLTRPLAKRLQDRGHRVVTVRSGDERALDGERPRLRPDVKEDFDALLERLAGEEPPLGHVVHLWAAEGQTAPREAEDLIVAQRRTTASLVALAQALAEREALSPRLWLVTQGAQLVDPAEAQADGRGLAEAPFLSLARTVVSELPRLRTTTVDLPVAARAADLGRLAGEMLAGEPELEVALRGERYVRRLQHLPAEELPPLSIDAVGKKPAVPYRVAMAAPGILDDLHLEEMAMPQPGAGEVVVEVKTGGLNFRDVMAATGLLPEEAESGLAWQTLGLECAGVVAAVGKGVRGIKVGEKVMTSAKGCFVSHLTVPAKLIHRMPRGLGFVEAATISSAFMTAYHALVGLAKLKRGERVLVHLATGGVGLAAIEICRMLGAEVYATAGSDAKRAYLRKLGVKKVMNSRSLDFADEVMAATGGRGVDVVLNALAGPAIEAGLSVLAPYGRFLEIGKRDIYADSAVSLRLLRKNITFHAIDLAAMGEERPEESAALFVELAGLLAKRKIKPLPTVVFPADQVAEAFRHMAAAKHIGKVVISFERPPAAVAKSRELGPAIRKDGAYLVTGGLGGFGAEVSRWLAERGAGALILVSRSGASTPAAKGIVQRLRRKGTKVIVARGDVAELRDVKQAVAAAEKSGLPLRGIVHSAMVLDDAFITQLTRERLDKVMRPKVCGAWNLHLATRDLPLDFFVTFSSVAAALGSSGQANYVAANGFLDAFARWRRALGLPAQSIGWGALGGTGVIERNAALQRYMQGMGLHPIMVEEALSGMAAAMCSDLPSLTYLKVDWPALSRAVPAIADIPRLAGVAAAFATGAGAGGQLRAELMAATEAARQAMLARFLRQQVAKVLKIDAGSIEMEQPLGELGLDSLSSFELKNRIETELAVSLPVGRFLQRPTLTGLAAAIAEALTTTRDSDEAETQGGTDVAVLPANVAFMLELYRRGLRATSFTSVFELGHAIAVDQRLDETRLRQALERVTGRHPTLRTAFPQGETGNLPRISPQHPLGLEVYEAEHLDEEAFDQLLRMRGSELLDIENGPLVRLQLFRRGKDRDVVLIRASHLVVDGWSMTYLLAELLGEYFGIVTVDEELTRAAAASDVTVQAAAEQAFLASEEGKRQMAYWTGLLAEPTPPYLTFLGRRRPPGPIVSLGSRYIALGKDRSRRVKAAAKRASTTSYSFQLAVAALFYGEILRRDDLLISTTVAARPQREQQALMVWFANLLAVRLRLGEAGSFEALLRQADEQVRNLLANQEVPFAAVLKAMGNPVDCLAAFGDATRAETSWHQIGFNARRPEIMDGGELSKLMLDDAGTKVKMGDMTIETLDLHRSPGQMDITLRPDEVDGLLYVYFVYNKVLFTEDEAAALERRFLALVDAAVAAPKSSLEALAKRADADSPLIDLEAERVEAVAT